MSVSPVGCMLLWSNFAMDHQGKFQSSRKFTRVCSPLCLRPSSSRNISLSSLSNCIISDSTYSKRYFNLFTLLHLGRTCADTKTTFEPSVAAICLSFCNCELSEPWPNCLFPKLDLTAKSSPGCANRIRLRLPHICTVWSWANSNLPHLQALPKWWKNWATAFAT